MFPFDHLNPTCAFEVKVGAGKLGEGPTAQGVKIGGSSPHLREIALIFPTADILRGMVSLRPRHFATSRVRRSIFEARRESKEIHWREAASRRIWAPVCVSPAPSQSG